MCFENIPRTFDALCSSSFLMWNFGSAFVSTRIICPFYGPYKYWYNLPTNTFVWVAQQAATCELHICEWSGKDMFDFHMLEVFLVNCAAPQSNFYQSPFQRTHQAATCALILRETPEGIYLRMLTEKGTIANTGGKSFERQSQLLASWCAQPRRGTPHVVPLCATHIVFHSLLSFIRSKTNTSSLIQQTS